MRLPPTAAGLALVCAALLAAAAGAAGPDCTAWPGELEPLPTAADPDFLRAEWARLRASELARVAQRIERADPVESERLWRHASCLDPASPQIVAGLDHNLHARSADVASGQAAPVAPAPAPGGAASRESAAPEPARLEAAAVRTRPSPPPVDAAPPVADPCRLGAEGCPRLRDADRMIAKIEGLVRGARFDEAAKAQKRARAILDGLPSSTATRAHRSRLEVLAATIDVARGNDDGARASFVRALASDPALRLDPVTTSPKVLHALDAARAIAAEQAAR